MIDWDALVLGPTHSVFAESATYQQGGGEPFGITVVFDEPTVTVEAAGMGVLSTDPSIGIRLHEFPADFDPNNAQEDTVVLTNRGRHFVVKTGRADSHGGARLKLNEVQAWPS